MWRRRRFGLESNFKALWLVFSDTSRPAAPLPAQTTEPSAKPAPSAALPGAIAARPVADRYRVALRRFAGRDIGLPLLIHDIYVVVLVLTRSVRAYRDQHELDVFLAMPRTVTLSFPWYCSRSREPSEVPGSVAV